MYNQVFSENVLVEIHGSRVLTYVHSSRVVAAFKIIGFNTPPVHILDYRPASLHAIRKVEQTGNPALFTGEFCQPARAIITTGASGETRIELFPYDGSPQTVLRVSVGDDSPPHDHLYWKAAPLGEHRHASVAVFRLHSLHRPTPIPAARYAMR